MRWGNRTVDLDILLWSGGAHCDEALTIPHPALLDRDFALVPAADVAPDWQVPGGAALASEVTNRGFALNVAQVRS